LSSPVDRDSSDQQPVNRHHESSIMAKTTRKLKKANHGRRPASAKARKAKRKKFRT
jgi:hypothetical protein